MPIYEYYCANCQRRFELIRPISKALEGAICPSCMGSAQRMPSLFYRSSEGSVASEASSACSTCSSNTCSSCHV